LNEVFQAGVGNLRLTDVQILESREPRQVQQARIRNLGVLQI
jgi:hypothetical protein